MFEFDFNSSCSLLTNEIGFCGKTGVVGLLDSIPTELCSFEGFFTVSTIVCGLENIGFCVYVDTFGSDGDESLFSKSVESFAFISGGSSFSLI